MLGLHRCVGSSLVAAHRLLIEVPSLVAELRRLRAHGLQQLQHMDRGSGSLAVEHRLNSCGPWA